MLDFSDKIKSDLDYHESYEKILNVLIDFGDESAAVTIFMKRGVNLETQRELGNYTTLIGADEHYVVGITDESKIIVAKFAVGSISL